VWSKTLESRTFNFRIGTVNLTEHIYIHVIFVHPFLSVSVGRML